jgi:hypothetical protein
MTTEPRRISNNPRATATLVTDLTYARCGPPKPRSRFAGGLARTPSCSSPARGLQPPQSGESHPQRQHRIQRGMTPTPENTWETTTTPARPRNRPATAGRVRGTRGRSRRQTPQRTTISVMTEHIISAPLTPNTPLTRSGWQWDPTTTSSAKCNRGRSAWPTQREGPDCAHRPRAALLAGQGPTDARYCRQDGRPIRDLLHRSQRAHPTQVDGGINQGQALGSFLGYPVRRIRAGAPGRCRGRGRATTEICDARGLRRGRRPFGRFVRSRPGRTRDPEARGQHGSCSRGRK